MAARSARARFNVIVALSLGGQLLAALAVGLAFADVRGAAQREAALNEQRVALSALGEAALALYTHEAHTYIEGGPGHLDHLAASETRLEAAVAAVVGLPLPGEAVTELSAAIQALSAERTHFTTEVAPAARSGALDRAQATAAHAVTESLAAQAARRIGAAMVALDGEAARARAEAQHATRRALVISAMAVAWGGLLAWGLARGLSRGHIGPLDALGQVARRLGQGVRDARAVEAGDSEVAALARTSRSSGSLSLGSPKITVSGLSSSWATAALSSPKAARRSAQRSASSPRRTVVAGSSPGRAKPKSPTTTRRACSASSRTSRSSGSLSLGSPKITVSGLSSSWATAALSSPKAARRSARTRASSSARSRSAIWLKPWAKAATS